MTANAEKLPGLKAKLAFAGRKFNAWWEGYAFDENAERAALQAKFPAAERGSRRPVEEIVGEAIWGEGRLEPGSPAWTMRFARMLSLPVRANVVIFGAGAGAPLSDLKHGTRWKAFGFTHAKNISQGNLRSYDMAMRSTDKSGCAGALSLFELHRDANPSAFAGFASNLLLPGAKAVFVDYATVRKGVRLRSCFPSVHHGAPKTDAEYRAALAGAGFTLEETLDETASFMALIAKGWAGWRQAYTAISQVENGKLRAEMMRAMAANAALWAERFEAMKSGQVRVLCFRATRK